MRVEPLKETDVISAAAEPLVDKSSAMGEILFGLCFWSAPLIGILAAIIACHEKKISVLISSIIVAVCIVLLTIWGLAKLFELCLEVGAADDSET